MVASAPQSLRGAAVSITQVTTAQETVTSSTTCGTCCDYTDDANLSLQSDTVVTELLLRFDSGRDLSCSEDVGCSLDPTIGGPQYARFEDDGTTVEVCFADPEGIDGPLALGQCDILTGFITPGPAEVVRALGADLKPIVPPPAVAVE